MKGVQMHSHAAEKLGPGGLVHSGGVAPTLQQCVVCMCYMQREQEGAVS